MRCGIEDLPDVAEILCADWAWIPSSNDSSPMDLNGRIKHTIKLLLDPDVYVFMPTHGLLFITIPFYSREIYEAHVIAKIEVRGKIAVECAQQCIDYMFTHTLCKRIITLTPVIYREAKRFAAECGFTREGLLKRSFPKNGLLIDRVIFGMDKE